MAEVVVVPSTIPPAATLIWLLAEVVVVPSTIPPELTEAPDDEVDIVVSCCNPIVLDIVDIIALLSTIPATLTNISPVSLSNSRVYLSILSIIDENAPDPKPILSLIIIE